MSSFHIGTNFEQDYTLVPVSAITHPLFVFKDHEGEYTKFFCTLPKRNWAQYFNSKIDDSNELVDEKEENTVDGSDKDGEVRGNRDDDGDNKGDGSEEANGEDERDNDSNPTNSEEDDDSTQPQ